jgi:tripartite-type tricarboxylate transporter receptor subunit TctC
MPGVRNVPRLLALPVASALALLAASAVPAQPIDDAAAYPTRTVRIIVSAPPGGGLDVVARVMADRLQQTFGHPVIVENRQGAGGNLGADVVAQAAPDGYTLLAAQPAPLTTNVALYRKLNFDPTAFEPIAIMTTIPSALVVRKDFPANSVGELIAYAKARPGVVTFGSQGIGTTPHLTAELFARRTGLELTHVPYRGTAAAVNDLVAGQIDVLFMQIDAVREHYRAGKVKILAVTVGARVPAVAEVPTMAEAGVADFRADSWNAIAAPPKTPAKIVAKLNQAINDVLRRPDVVAHLEALTMQPVGGTPEETRKFLQEETQRWGDVIRAASISVD